MVSPEPLPTLRPECPSLHVPDCNLEVFVDVGDPSGFCETVAGWIRKVAEESDPDDAGSYSTKHHGHSERGDRQGRLKWTREATLDEKESWSEHSNLAPVYWLNGPAWAGKLAIAQTIVEHAPAGGRPGTPPHPRNFEGRGNPRHIPRPAHKYPEFRSILVPLFRSNPDIVRDLLYNQMETSVIEVSNGPRSRLINHV